MRTTAVALLLVLLGCSKHEEETPFARMAKASHGDMSPGIPIYSVKSLKAAQHYYREHMGFKVEWEHGEPPDFGAMKRGDFVLFLCAGCPSTSSRAMTFVKDVDKLHDEYVKRKAIITMPPTDMPWGLREMHVSDPDGNMIRFGGDSH